MVIIDGGEGGQGCGRPWNFTEAVMKPSLKSRAYERRQERGILFSNDSKENFPSRDAGR